VVLAGALLAALVWIYNRLVAERNLARAGFADIDVQLKRRADLIPNLVDTVKGYAGHEREVLEEVTRLRAEVGKVPPGDVAERGKLEGMLSGAIGRLLAAGQPA